MNIVDTLELSDNAIRVLKSRYLLRNDSGEVYETPGQLFERVAKAVSKAEFTWSTSLEAEKWEQKFLDIMQQLRFLPNSPTLMNAGTRCNQLSACFVLPVEDHLEDIFSTLKLAALIQQSGGGTGFNFSHLRPKDDRLQRTQGTASGPVSFMKIFNAATEHVKQGGKRRGANMGILNIDHPDIEEFINCKWQESDLSNFNISVGVTDAFMETLNQGGMWELIHPNTHAVARRIKATTLWDAIIQNAFRGGDPGLIFIDAINSSNPTKLLGKIEATNPCGEVPLLPFESCNLGSINLSKFIINHQDQPSLDWHALEKTISIAIRFLDNVIEVNHYLAPEIKEIAYANRKIGLGIMGWAEALAILGIPYESGAALELGEKLMKYVSEKSWDVSVDLAKERGCFRNWKKSIYYPHSPVRNATRTSIAPTGTISIIADTTPSIEPFFALAFERKHVLNNESLFEINKALLQQLEINNLKSEENVSCIMKTGTLQSLKTLPRKIRDLYKTALEISPVWHLKHQAAFQKFTDNAVSKTINLPQESTPEDISIIYQNAWKEKLKGITVFRQRSRENQVITSGITGHLKGCKICIE